METIIERRFKSGFVVSEQDLRKLVQTCHEHAIRLKPEELSSRISVDLKDGSSQVLPALDDLFNLDNSTRNAVAGVEVIFTDVGTPPTETVTVDPPWEIHFWFSGKGPYSEGASIFYRVSGPTRDWTVLTASDIEERILRCKRTSWVDPLSKRAAIPIAMLVSILLAMIAIGSSVSLNHIPAELKRQVASGEIKDALSAIVFLEEARASRFSTKGGLPLLVAAMVTPILVVLVSPLFARIFPSRVFYWGDAIQRYDRTKVVKGFIWTGVVGAVVVGLAINYLSKQIGI